MKHLDFKKAFKYPFNRAKGLWNIMLVFLPIIGWFALGGYGIRIVKEFIKGKFKQLPKLKFYDDLSLGFMMFLKSLPFVLTYTTVLVLLNLILPLVSSLAQFFLSLFVVPMLTINFFKKETVKSLFEFRIIKYVFKNFVDYLVALLLSIALSVVFFVMWIILVGIPAGSFTKYIFLADFYRQKVK